MKKLSVLALFLAAIFCQGQKQGNVWYFGTQSGLNFNSGIPVPITGGQTGTDVGPGGSQEGTASISDSSGALLFYTGGKTIWNRFHAAMPNGTAVSGGTSSTQSSLIIPLPSNDSLFYVFTSDEFQSYYSPAVPKGYRYSVVNMCLDNKKGDVVQGQKNILLIDSATEKLAACRDAAGTGYWILGHKMFSSQFIAWHLTSGGITNTVSTIIGPAHGWHVPSGTWLKGAAQGQMKINSQGNKVALAVGNFQPGYLNLFDFNASTGIVSNYCNMVIDSAMGKSMYGVEFSPDGSKLYATTMGGAGGSRIYQFDMLAGGGSCSAIKASVIWAYQQNQNSVMFGMQLGPDKKIYVVCDSYYTLGCIKLPNLTAPACNFTSNALSISGVINNYALPSFVAAYSYSNNLVACCSSPNLTTSTSMATLCAGSTATLTAMGAGFYSWSNGASGSLITVSPTITTTYTIIGSNSAGCPRTTILTQNVKVCAGIEEIGEGNFDVSIFPNPGNGQIKILCPLKIENVLIFNEMGQLIYQASPNKQEMEVTIEYPGIYFVSVTGLDFHKNKKVQVLR